MLRGEFPDAGERTPAELRAAYEARLASVVDAVGAERVREATDLDAETVAAIAAGESPTLTVEEASSVLALEEDQPPASALSAEAREILLMGMTRAVVDVERLASGIDAAIEPREIQAKVEGRQPTTLAEYATLHQYLEANTE